MKSAKGPGNFRNLFIYSPDDKKDCIQIILLSEVAAKDEFLNIKNVIRGDVMAAHCIPPWIMWIRYENFLGLGIRRRPPYFSSEESILLQKRLFEINYLLHKIILFKKMSFN